MDRITNHMRIQTLIFGEDYRLGRSKTQQSFSGGHKTDIRVMVVVHEFSECAANS